MGRIAAFTAATVLAVAALAAGLAVAAPSGAAEVTVVVGDMTFSPPTITVQVGDTVTWVVESGLAHTVTADDGSFGSGTLGDGATFSTTFTEAGTFPYHCQLHGAAGGIGMAGVVVVEGGEGPTTTGSGPANTGEVPGAPTTAPATAGPGAEGGGQTPRFTG